MVSKTDNNTSPESVMALALKHIASTYREVQILLDLMTQVEQLLSKNQAQAIRLAEVITMLENGFTNTQILEAISRMRMKSCDD